MCDKNVLTSDGKKLYLAIFELVNGGYEHIFYRLIYAKNGKDI